MYDKFGRDWKTRDYFLLHLVCNGLQQVIIQGTGPFFDISLRAVFLSRGDQHREYVSPEYWCVVPLTSKSLVVRVDESVPDRKLIFF